MVALLSKHHDDLPNFACRRLVAPAEKVDRAMLFGQLRALFATPADAALFYFAGHGAVSDLGGYLVTPEVQRYEDGLAMRDLVALANQAHIAEVLIILDCCHSGAIGTMPELRDGQILLREGVSMLTASRPEESAVESREGGLFTSLICEALSGGGADILGNVTVASLYAYVDQTLDAWDQRPMLKSYLSRLAPIRRCAPTVSPAVLRLLPSYFATADSRLDLDPSYEPDALPHDAAHETIFAHLQQLRAAGLLYPIGEDHLYFAAIHRTGCKLTPLGQFYWRLGRQGNL